MQQPLIYFLKAPLWHFDKLYSSKRSRIALREQTGASSNSRTWRTSLHPYWAISSSAWILLPLRSASWSIQIKSPGWLERSGPCWRREMRPSGVVMGHSTVLPEPAWREASERPRQHTRGGQRNISAAATQGRCGKKCSTSPATKPTTSQRVRVGSHHSASISISIGSPPGPCSEPPTLHPLHSWLHPCPLQQHHY